MDDYTNGIKDIAQRYKPKKGLEIGLHEGNSARAYLDGCSGTLVSVDIRNHYQVEKKLDQKRFSVIIGDSVETMEAMAKKGEKFDYIYIDGDHRYEGVKRDIIAAIPLLDKNGVMVFDDYGVTGGWGLTFNAEGVEMNGEYGVKKAVDELITKGWKEIPTKLANGGKAFVRG